MSTQTDSLPNQEGVNTTQQPTRSAATVRRRVHWSLHAVIQWLHRWATLTLGILLIVTTVSGVIALFEFDLNRLSHPNLYHATPTMTPVSLDEVHDAFVKGVAGEPALAGATFGDIVTSATDSSHVYLYGEDDSYLGMAFVDPGTGKYLGYYNEDQTVWGWFAKLHYSLFADTVTFTYPEWVPEWLKIFLGESLADLLLKNAALSLFILVLTGAYLWWPGIKKLAFGFRIRPDAKGFNWHYDWHKVLGFISLPFLLMWALTGLNFYSPYSEGIQSIWYAATFSAKPSEEPEDLQSVPTEGAMISAETAKRVALATVPGAQFVSIAIPEQITDTMDIWLSQGVDPYAYGEFPGQVYIRLDAFSAAVLYNSAAVDTSWASYIYEWWFYPIHAGVSVNWPVRLIWAAFGLMPAFLAYTGFMQWWIRRQKRKAIHLNQGRPKKALVRKDPLTGGDVG